MTMGIRFEERSLDVSTAMRLGDADFARAEGELFVVGARTGKEVIRLVFAGGLAVGRIENFDANVLCLLRLHLDLPTPFHPARRCNRGLHPHTTGIELGQ